MPDEPITHHSSLTTRHSIGLAAYGFGYLCGFAGAGTPRACPQPLDAYALMDLAASHGLGGVEFPPQWCLGSLAPDALARARAYAEERGLFVVLDAGIVDTAELESLLHAAAAIGAPTVRTIVSSLLCGDRRAVRDTWQEYLAETARKVRAVCGLAEELGVAIALENHQDVTSQELVWLCEQAGSPVGVNLDAINPLAVVEDPLAFARRVAPYLKNVHLKDYNIYRTPQGYRLVRSPIGHGALDVPALLDLCAREAPAATISIELGALQARHVQFLEDDFWPGYPPRRIEDVLPPLRLRERQARPDDEDWRTPWEREEDGSVQGAYEMEQFEQSVAYLRSIGR